jgi:hypothetical protein
VGPYRIVKRVGVDYRIVSKGRKEMVVHHDQLKHSYIPVQDVLGTRTYRRKIVYNRYKNV